MAIDAPQAVGRSITPDFDVELFQATPAASSLAKTGFWGEDGFSFGDLLDLINPLQHIPIISNVYRAVTGDQIAAGPRLLGGGLFGGPIGLAVSMANLAVEDATGNDVGGHILAAAGFGEPQSDAPRRAAICFRFRFRFPVDRPLPRQRCRQRPETTTTGKYSIGACGPKISQPKTSPKSWPRISGRKSAIRLPSPRQPIQVWRNSLAQRIHSGSDTAAALRVRCPRKP